MTLFDWAASQPPPSRPTASDSILDSHERNLSRVSERIGAAILDFCKPGREFHVDELRVFVEARCGKVAPASSDRILRQLRLKGRVNYVVLSRKDSLYQVTK